MSRMPKMFAGLLVGAAVAGTPAPAAAQFMMGRPGVPFGFVNPYGLTPSYNTFGYTTSLYYNTPFGGYSFSYSRTSNSSYLLPSFGYPVAGGPIGFASAGNAALSPLYYGASAGPVGAVYDQQTANLQRAQRAARNDPAARQQMFDNWAVERGGGKPAAPDRTAVVPEAARLALAPVSDDEVRTGRPLNAAVKAVLGIDARRSNARPPFFTPDVLTQMVLAGGPAADAWNAFRRDPRFPAALSGSEFDAGRAAVAKEFAAVVDPPRAGRKPDPAAPARLTAAVAGLREQFRLRAGDGSAASKEATAFLDGLSAAAAAMGDRDADGYLPAGWFTAGASAADVVRHLDRYKLTFAPAAADDDGGYLALYRGLTQYLSDLTQR